MTQWSEHWNSTWVAAFKKALEDVPAEYRAEWLRASRELEKERDTPRRMAA